MDSLDLIVGGIGIVIGVAYAAILEPWRPSYERQHLTWLVVAIGTALTLALAALRIGLGVPPLLPSAAAWWALWRVCGAFVATGTPIIAWQVRLRGRHLAEIIAYARREP